MKKNLYDLHTSISSSPSPLLLMEQINKASAQEKLDQRIACKWAAAMKRKENFLALTREEHLHINSLQRK